MGSTLPDDPDGFARFYEYIFERTLPRHARRDWIEPLYAARAEGKGLVVEAFRGSAKTTTLTIAFTAFRLGHEPAKSALLIQAGNQAAAITGGAIAALIEHHPGWGRAFPDVKPDRNAGWGAKRYELVDVEADYAVWRQLCTRVKGKDPSLAAMGYASRAIIGKHPTGILVVDDIHDETNTRSRRELDKVLTILRGTILPTLVPGSWQLFVGTPWTSDDALATLKATGQYLSVATPIFLDGKVPAWPERFPVEEINKARQLTGEKEFARMYLLDLNAAQGIHLKAEWLGSFSHERIQLGWPVVMGVDYASAVDQLKGQDRDYFAVAIGRVIPGGGGVVLVDGFRGRVSQGEAEHKVKELHDLYPTTQMIGVEAVGKGEEFYYLLHKDWGLPVVRMHPGGKSKGLRFETGMAPLFEYGRAFLADVERPFLAAFRDEWMRWPQGEHDDTLDAVYWMLNAGQDFLLGSRKRDKRPNPFGEFGRQ